MKTQWALVVVATLCGWFLPDFYDWSGEDQSRPASVVRWIFLGMIALNVMVLGWMAWLYVKERKTTQPAQPVLSRFGIRHILMATLLVALVVTSERLVQLPLVNGLVLALVAYLIYLAVRVPEWRWGICTLMICMWGPFLWVFRWPEFHGSMLQVLTIMPSLPALLPAAFFNHLIGLDMMNMMTHGFFTIAEVLIGVWLMWLSKRLATAYWLATLTVALVSSFGLQAMVRM